MAAKEQVAVKRLAQPTQVAAAVAVAELLV